MAFKSFAWALAPPKLRPALQIRCLSAVYGLRGASANCGPSVKARRLYSHTPAPAAMSAMPGTSVAEIQTAKTPITSKSTVFVVGASRGQSFANTQHQHLTQTSH
jgi:hypothetical protein